MEVQLKESKGNQPVYSKIINDGRGENSRTSHLTEIGATSLE